MATRYMKVFVLYCFFVGPSVLYATDIEQSLPRSRHEMLYVPFESNKNKDFEGLLEAEKDLKQEYSQLLSPGATYDEKPPLNSLELVIETSYLCGDFSKIVQYNQLLLSFYPSFIPDPTLLKMMIYGSYLVGKELEDSCRAELTPNLNLKVSASLIQVYHQKFNQPYTKMMGTIMRQHFDRCSEWAWACGRGDVAAYYKTFSDYWLAVSLDEALSLL